MRYTVCLLCYQQFFLRLVTDFLRALVYFYREVENGANGRMRHVLLNYPQRQVKVPRAAVKRMLTGKPSGKPTGCSAAKPLHGSEIER